MAVTLDQLRIFRAIVAHGRVSLAAAAMGVSQPSVSQQLRRLEDALGFALIKSNEGRLVPTERGQRVLEIADLMTQGSERLQEFAEEARLGTHAVLTVGANTTGGMYFIPDVIRLFQEKQSGVRVKLRIGSVHELTLAVVGGVCDLAVVGGPITAREFSAVTLFTDRLPLLVPPSHPFGTRGKIAVSELKGQQFVLPAVGSRTRLVVETALRGVGVELEGVLEYLDTESVKKAVEANLGIAYLSREGVRREMEHGYLKEVRVEGFDIERPFQAFWLRDRPPSKLMSKFIEAAQEVVSNRSAPSRRRF